jgi:hypothetical protein
MFQHIRGVHSSEGTQQAAPAFQPAASLHHQHGRSAVFPPTPALRGLNLHAPRIKALLVSFN